jgi:hypothetical protein
MHHILRRARGVLVMALFWAAAWAVVGAAYGTWLRQRFPITAVIRDGVRLAPPTVLETALWSAGVAAAWGLACGAAFAALLMSAERRSARPGGTPPAWRMALWGAVAALVGFGGAGALALLPVAGAAGIAAGVGAVIAAGLVVVAGRASAPRLTDGAHPANVPLRGE